MSCNKLRLIGTTGVPLELSFDGFDPNFLRREKLFKFRQIKCLFQTLSISNSSKIDVKECSLTPHIESAHVGKVLV